MHTGFTDAPKLSPPAGVPPIAPGSTVGVKYSSCPSSLSTAAITSGIPIP